MAYSTIELDSRALQMLAHPVRARILTELRMNGAATATTLAAALATNTGATSYHLRKLAEVELVEHAKVGRGKERWWKAASDAHRWGPRTVVGDPDGQAANRWLKQHYLQQFIERYSEWLDQSTSAPLEWQEAAEMSDRVLAITPEQLQAMTAEILTVVDRYAGVPAESQSDARPVHVFLQTFPVT